MPTRRIAVAALVACLALSVTGAEPSVKVSGSDIRFPMTITRQVGGKTVRLVLTGTALRKKYGFSVYAIGSYIQEGAAVRDAEGLMRSTMIKQLHLVFERDIDGATMASSFRDSIGMNHPAPAFATELARLAAFFQANPVRYGDHIWLTSIPERGLSCQTSRKAGVMIESVQFAHAAWETYLGRKNLGVALQSGLSSRL